jgi:hypothetical protein
MRHSQKIWKKKIPRRDSESLRGNIKYLKRKQEEFLDRFDVKDFTSANRKIQD